MGMVLMVDRMQAPPPHPDAMTIVRVGDCPNPIPLLSFPSLDSTPHFESIPPYTIPYSPKVFLFEAWCPLELYLSAQ